MAPGLAGIDLLYISNVYTVTVYSYPQGKHVGTLKGFYQPLGECVNRAGDVFVANEDTIVEFKHGGTKPIQTLTSSGYAAISCATDPMTGNLAVTWLRGASNSSYVAIYPNATGTPTLYTNGDMWFAFCGYDAKGNLYVDGTPGSEDVFKFAELHTGSSKMKNIKLRQSFGGGFSAVQWDGQYIAVTDTTANKIYRFAISGRFGTLKGTVPLGNAQGLYQTWIEGNKVVGADDVGDAVWYWHYPAGGAAIKSITKAVDHPFGATISKAIQ